jgi:hypothetical protein
MFLLNYAFPFIWKWLMAVSLLLQILDIGSLMEIDVPMDIISN